MAVQLDNRPVDDEPADELDPTKEWYSLAQLGEVLDVSPRTLYKWLSRGEFPDYSRLPSRQVRVHRDDLLAWMYDRRNRR